MAKVISLERERAVRELRAAVGPEEAERILKRVARIMERVLWDPVFRARMVAAMERNLAR